VCYGFFNGGECCEPVDQPGSMDLYCTTTVHLRQSTVRRFVRTCANNTLANADNGNALESVWAAERADVSDLAYVDRHREILVSNASWDKSHVYQLERCHPVIYDELSDFLATDFSNLNTRDPVIYPIVDPSGQGWKVWSPARVEGPSTVHLATMNLQRSDFTANVELNTQLSNLKQGIAFRVLDDKNYLRYSFRPSSGNVELSLEQVLDGVVAVLWTGFLGGGSILSVSAVGDQVSVTGAPSAFTIAALKDETRVGLWNISAGTTSGNKVLNFAADSAAPVKLFLSVCDTSPAVVAQIHDDDSYAKTGFLASGPAFALWVYDKYQTVSSSVVSLAIPSGPAYNIGAPGTELWAFQKIGSGGDVTTFDQMQYQRTGESWQHDNTSPLQYYTSQGLGYTAAPCLAKHAANKGAGYLARSTDTTFTFEYNNGGNNFYRRDQTIHHAIVLGGVTFDDPAVVPSVQEELVVIEFDTTFTDHDVFNTTPLSDAQVRAHMSLCINAGDTIGGGFAVSYKNAVAFFEATPSLSAWLVDFQGFHGGGLGGRSYGDQRFFVGGADWKVDLTADRPTKYTVAVADGEDGKSYVALMRPIVSSSGGFGPPTITQAGRFTIYGPGGGIVFETTTGITGLSAVRCASDRFFYLSGMDFTSAQATASPPNGAGSSSWMVSLDGTIRYPCMAVSRQVGATPAAYRARPEAELDGFNIGGHGGHLFNGADVDCIKSSALPRSPKLENPTF
jgi:hypothetical protein